MSKLEIWLCRVLLHPITRQPMNTRDLRPDKHQLVMAKIVNGEIGSLPDGTIIDPVEGFATEELANEARARKLVDDPEGDYRVVVTMQVSG